MKLIVFLLVAITIPISTSILVTYHYTKSSIKDTYIANNSNVLYHGSQNVEHYLTKLNQASLLLYYDMRNEKSFHQIMTESDFTFVSHQNLFVNLNYMANTVTDLTQIYLYLERSDTSHRYAYNIKRYTEGKTYDITIPNDRDYIIEPTHLSHTYNINKFPYEDHTHVISLHKNILNLPSDEILGTLTLDIKLDTINEMSDLLFNKQAEQLYIVDEQGHVIYNSHHADNMTLQQWLAQIKQSEHTNFYEFKDDQFEGIHLFQPIQSPIGNWTIIKRIPYDYLFTDARELTFINSSIVGLFLIIAIIAILYISYYFTSPLKRMLRYINQVEIGKMESTLETKRTDEFGILSRRFQQLIQNLNHAITNEYKLVLANRTNQLKALQAQINPHFLNNALQSIGTLALQNNQKHIYNLITSLGRMMRYQINTSELPVKLTTELEYVTNYLQLQSQRFENQFHFFFNIQEEAKHLEVPRMLLQPIVENCFKHGFVKHNNNGEIWIKAVCTNNELIITVTDNGIGMSVDQLNRLQKQLQTYMMHDINSHELGEHIGLFNTQARLQLQYNKQASLKLQQNSPNGLVVAIHILLESEVGKYETTHRG